MLKRNEMLTKLKVFLRALDYFRGILFLTTNRVGSFDEAFMSRIHLQIGYPALDDSARVKIWNNNFTKLKSNKKDGGKKFDIHYRVKDYIQGSSDLLELKWNGREIRNGKSKNSVCSPFW